MNQPPNTTKENVKMVLWYISAYVLILLMSMGLASIKDEYFWWSLPIAYVSYFYFLKNLKYFK